MAFDTALLGAGAGTQILGGLISAGEAGANQRVQKNVRRVATQQFMAERAKRNREFSREIHSAANRSFGLAGNPGVGRIKNAAADAEVEAQLALGRFKEFNRHEANQRAIAATVSGVLSLGTGLLFAGGALSSGGFSSKSTTLTPNLAKRGARNLGGGGPSSPGFNDPFKVSF